MTGSFTTQIDCDGQILTSRGKDDIFLLSLDDASNGTVIWASSWGGPSSNNGFAVARDAGGDLVLTGYFTNNITVAGTFIRSQGPGLPAYVGGLYTGSVTWNATTIMAPGQVDAFVGRSLV